MTVPERDPLRLHVEDPTLFREAVGFTASETRFAARLVEKDYFSSVLLRHLAAADAGLVFRGGTCLAKVHARFYRLSEDLDFLVPTPVDASRADRSDRAQAAKRAVARIAEALPGLRVVAPLRGANDSRQYAATIGYETLVSPHAETIKVELGLREPLLTDPVQGEARTLLLDPVSGAPFVPSLRVTCVSRQEAMAEKLRAALSRREVAIRDFYDVDHAVRQMGLRPEDDELTALVRRKLAVPGNTPVDVTEARLAALKQQVRAELRPVLRDSDFAEFDLERAFATVADLARHVSAQR
jgi:predicted nucleotidyltransferase component of viral defense system